MLRADKPVAIEKRVDETQELLFLFARELLDAFEAALNALAVKAVAGFDSFDAKEFVSGDTKKLGDTGEKMRRGIVGLGFVVRDHTLRGAEFGGELALGEARGSAKFNEAVAEGVAIGLYGQLSGHCKVLHRPSYMEDRLAAVFGLT